MKALFVAFMVMVSTAFAPHAYSAGFQASIIGANDGLVGEFRGNGWGRVPASASTASEGWHPVTFYCKIEGYNTAGQLFPKSTGYCEALRRSNEASDDIVINSAFPICVFNVTGNEYVSHAKYDFVNEQCDLTIDESELNVLVASGDRNILTATLMFVTDDTYTNGWMEHTPIMIRVGGAWNKATMETFYSDMVPVAD